MPHDGEPYTHKEIACLSHGDCVAIYSKSIWQLWKEHKIGSTHGYTPIAQRSWAKCYSLPGLKGC